MRNMLSRTFGRQVPHAIDSPRSFAPFIFNLSFLCALILIAGLSGAQQAMACAPTIKTDLGVYNEPTVPPTLPSAGGKFCDPTFGTEIMRVTDANDSPSNGTYYSTWPTFNKDNTRLLVKMYNFGATYTFDPATFTLTSAKQTIPGLPNGGGSFITEGAIWSNTDPNVLYGGGWSSPKLWSLNVATGVYTLVRDFSNVAGVSSNDYFFQMSMSEDNDVFAFTHKSSNGTNQGYIVYRRSTNTIISNVTSAYISGSKINEVQIDKSGRYLSISLECSQCASFYLRDLQTGLEYTLDDDGDGNPSLGHADTGTANIVGWDRWDNRILYRHLGDLQNYTELLTLPDWTQAKHFSMRAINEGWALVSFFSYDTSLPRNGVFHNEIVQVATDGSRRVRRLLHHRVVYQGDYWEQPHANISRDGKFVAFTSNWGGTSQDDLFIARIDPAPSQHEFWTNVVGATANGSDLTKTGATGWNAGATSAQTIIGGNGYVEFSTNETTKGKAAGLNHNHVGHHYDEIDYAIFLSSANNVRIYENGTDIGLFGTYAAGDRFRVAIENGVVKYYQNGTLLYTSGQTPVYPLVLDASLYTAGATITDAVLSIDVIWYSILGATANGNDLTKTGATGWNAGAISLQPLSGGDGYIEFSTNETTKGKAAGLNHNHVGHHYDEIDYAIFLSSVNNVRIYENGTDIGLFGTYAAGDRFRISVENGVVKYYQNGTLLYTSGQTPVYPLVLDASLYTAGATITDAMIAGSDYEGLR